MNTTYMDYLRRGWKNAEVKGIVRPLGGTMSRTFGRKPGRPIKVTFKKLDDPTAVAEDIARYCFKEAPLMEYEEPGSDSLWEKVSRGILNPMSQENKMFKINLTDHIETEWIAKLGKKPSTVIPKMIDEDAVAEAKEVLEKFKEDNPPPGYFMGTRSVMNKRKDELTVKEWETEAANK